MKDGGAMGSRLNGKVAIVTGAGSGASGIGIGEAISIVLAREGTSVLLVDKDVARAETTRRSLEGGPGKGEIFRGDVSSPSDCEAMVRAATDRFGGVDILINNAAISKHAPITATSLELYESIVGVNLAGPFWSSKYAIPSLIARGGGSIVNIGSVAAVRDSGTTHPAYCASKAALLGLTVDLAGAYGRHNIRVNTVLPGMVATPMQESVGRVDDDRRARLNLLGRMGSAWDIAHAVLFLSSDEAAYLTGVTLPVDGGATAAMPASTFRATTPTGD
jgi:NAD(P)-dependent dehydrogenase (short-subunit alcohol dehydrogenase family)